LQYFYNSFLGWQIPLIRKPIKGTSVNQELFYEKSKEEVEDEVEDLFELVKEAKEQYKIEAVSSGAILSDYQRLRVENVCDRLGLISLSYLWQKDQTELLDSMIENGLDARFVKIGKIIF
jgi:diphthine-ammonia ligase